MTLRNLSASGLIALSLLSPAFASAQGVGHLNPDLRRLVNRAQQSQRREERLKHKVDVKVSLVGKATAVNGTTITLLASNGTSYSVDASSAKFIRRYGGAMVITDIQTNDQLYIQAALTSTGTTMTLKAKLVQDMSLQARNGTFVGTVQSISGTSFVLQSHNRGLQTIFTSSTTKIMKGSAVATFADLTVGSNIRVDGVWDNANNNVTASKIQIVVKQEEVHLNGTVVSVGGTSMTFTADGKTYGVDLSKSKIAARNYFGTDASKLHVGDAVQVWGKMMTDSLQVKASLVIDFSL